VLLGRHRSCSVPGNRADGCGAGRVHGLGVWDRVAAETAPGWPRAVAPYTPTKSEAWVSGRIGAHGQARDAAAAAAPVALTPRLTGSNRAGKGLAAGTWAAHRLVCSPPPPTPAALHGEVGGSGGSLSAEQSVSSERRRGEGRMALERRRGTHGGTIAGRHRRSWAHPLRQLPAYRATARNDRVSRAQQSVRGGCAKTASLFGSRWAGAQESPKNQGSTR